MTTMNGTATMNENSPVLRVENLSKTFGSRTLWKGHDLLPGIRRRDNRPTWP